MNVFGKTFRKFRDFFVWFFLILVMFTTAYYFEYANTGGNTDMDNLQNTFTTVSQLTMGFYDYGTLVNDALGTGPYVFGVIIQYWLLIFLMLMFAFNIILAAVGSAYDEAA